MNRSSGTTISAELGLKLVVPQQTIVPLVASMYYSGSDPYAVRMAFHVGTDEPVEWIFARDLLAAGSRRARVRETFRCGPPRNRSRKPASWT